ncbi:MAG: hypothetical protein U1D30_05490 [Planctomycetota bacterium]
MPRSEEQIAAEHQVLAPFVAQRAQYLEALHAEVDSLLDAWRRLEQTGLEITRFRTGGRMLQTIVDLKGLFCRPRKREPVLSRGDLLSLEQAQGRGREDHQGRQAFIPAAIVADGSPQNVRIHLRAATKLSERKQFFLSISPRLGHNEPSIPGEIGGFNALIAARPEHHLLAGRGQSNPAFTEPTVQSRQCRISAMFHAPANA